MSSKPNSRSTSKTRGDNNNNDDNTNIPPLSNPPSPTPSSSLSKLGNTNNNNNNDNQSIQLLLLQMQQQFSSQFSFMQSQIEELKVAKVLNHDNNITIKKEIKYNPNNYHNSSSTPIIINDNNNGITFTSTGNKVAPNYIDEHWNYPSAEQCTNATLFLTDKKSVDTFINHINTIGMRYYPSPGMEISSLKFNTFTGGDNAIEFIKWQDHVIEEAEEYNLDYYITTSWEIIFNKVMNSTLADNVKIGVIIRLRDICKVLYSKLKSAIKEESFVNSTIDALVREHKHSKQYFINGNVNFLYRSLDHYYERVTTNTVAALNSEFNNYKYNGAVSVDNTTAYFVGIDEFRTKFNKFKVPKQSYEFTEKVKNDLPKELYQFGIYALIVNNNDYSDLKQIITKATMQLCRGDITDSESANHVGTTKPRQGNDRRNNPSDPNAYCSYCEKNGHSTANHFPCRKCKQQHKRGECSYNQQSASTPGQSIALPDSSMEFAAHVAPLQLFGDEEKVYLADENGNYKNSRSEAVADSGCSVHLCCNEELLFNIVDISPMQIRLPDGKIYTIYKTGSMMLTPTFHIKSVLLLPNFTTNLISIGRLAQLGFNTVITKEGARVTTIRGGQSKFVMLFPKEGNLYIKKLSIYKPSLFALAGKSAATKIIAAKELVDETKQINSKVHANSKVKLSIQSSINIPKKAAIAAKPTITFAQTARTTMEMERANRAHNAVIKAAATGHTKHSSGTNGGPGSSSITPASVPLVAGPITATSAAKAAGNDKDDIWESSSEGESSGQ